MPKKDLEVNARDLLDYVQGLRKNAARINPVMNDATSIGLANLEKALGQMDMVELENTIFRVQPPTGVCPTCKRKL